MANERNGSTAPAASNAVAATTRGRARYHTAITRTGATATMVVLATINSPQTSAAERQCSRPTSHANSASSGQYAGVWPMDMNPRNAGLKAMAATTASQAKASAYRPRHASATAAAAHAIGTNSAPKIVTNLTSACSRCGTSIGAHMTMPYGSGAGHGTLYIVYGLRPCSRRRMPS